MHEGPGEFSCATPTRAVQNYKFILVLSFSSFSSTKKNQTNEQEFEVKEEHLRRRFHEGKEPVTLGSGLGHCVNLGPQNFRQRV